MNPGMTDQAHLSIAWRRLAGRTRTKVNLGWWLARAMPLLVIAGVAGFAVIFLLRSSGMVLDANRAWSWAAGSLVVLLCMGWWLARRQFISSAQALVRLA